MFSCDQVMAELATYLDDQVMGELRRELEVHLAHCQTCRVLFDSTRKTLTIVTESGSFEVPEDLSEKLVNEIITKVRSSRSRRPRPES